MTKPESAVFHAIKREYNYAVRDYDEAKNRSITLQANLADCHETMELAMKHRRELDNFAATMGWSVKDLIS